MFQDSNGFSFSMSQKHIFDYKKLFHRFYLFFWMMYDRILRSINIMKLMLEIDE